MMIPTDRLNRRTFLRGAGAVMALPLLEAMTPRRVLAAGPTGPRRAMFVFTPNGVNKDKWYPEGGAGDLKLSPTLEPLASLRDKVCLLEHLGHNNGRALGDGAGDHARSSAVFLTGAHPRKTAGPDIKVGASIDQLIARHVGGQTRFASLELGAERGANAGNCDSGYSCAYSANVSWRDEKTPVNKEVNPRAVFDRLFGETGTSPMYSGAGQKAEFHRSILDLVMEDAKRLHGKVGAADQAKLDEYLTGVREIERRVGDGKGTVRVGDVDYVQPDGVPRDYGEHIKLMMDMAAMAFQTDSTRVVTLMMANAGSNRSYHQIGVPDAHHRISHHRGNAELREKIARIDRYHVGLLAHLLQRLDRIPEGDGSVLDNSLVVYGSGLGDGNRHDHLDLPLLLAGGGGGTVRGGRRLVFDDRTPMSNLLLSVARTMDVPLDRFADSTGELGQLPG